MNIKEITVPHSYRNRFMKNYGNTTIVKNSSGSGGGGGGGGSFEPHYLWGQYFDDTKDIDGDLTSNGTVRAQSINAQDGYVVGMQGVNLEYTNIKGAQGTFTNGVSAQHANVYDIQGVQANFDTFAGHQGYIDGIQGQQANFTQFTGSQANIIGIQGTNLNYTNIRGAQGDITRVNSQYLDVAVSAYIKELLAKDITTENLTVTKAAHFFKLIIDEIKASKGQLIITPANATLDIVEEITGGWRCYFLANDGDKEIHNSFEAGDQVVCQTFNAATGVSYNVSNKYYWRLCTAVSSTPVNKTINGETVACHYIDLSSSDQDQYSNAAPAAGDEIVMLGNRNDSTRQAAIIISAYTNPYLDNPTSTADKIYAPSIVQYNGIGSTVTKRWNLTPCRVNVISRDKNTFKGDFVVVTGDDEEDILDLINSSTPYIQNGYWYINGESTGVPATGDDGNSPYIGSNGNWWIGNTDTGVKAQGPKGDKGDDGTSVEITSQSVTYARSTSGTTIPSTWQSSIPSTGGPFVWTKTNINWSDGHTTNSYSVGYEGADGTSVTVSSTSVKYAITTSGTQPADSAFIYDSIPSVSLGDYVWCKEIVNFSDGAQIKSYSVSRIGEDGENGTPGANGSSTHWAYATNNQGANFSTTMFNGATWVGTYTDTTVADSTNWRDYTWTQLKGDIGPQGPQGNNGTSISITSTSVQYQVSNSGTTTPTGTWQNNVPSADPGQFIWTRTIVTYSDGTSTTTYSVSRDGKNGASGTTIDTTSVTYAVTNTNVQPADSAFTYSSIPPLNPGQYLWTKQVINYDDGTSIKSYSVSRIGTDGTNGQPGLNGKTTHWAYATNNSGANFSTTMFNGATWVGTYDDTNLADSTNWRDYTWTPLKGDTGPQGPQGNNGTSISITSTSVQYQVSNSGTTTPTGTWQNSVPSASAGQFIWTRTIVNYSDGTKTTTYSVSRYGTNGTSITITNTSVTYAVTNTNTQPADSAFTYSSIPTLSQGQYLWTKQIVTYSDGTSTKSYSVSRIGSDGTNGTPGLNGKTTHWAYATNNSGANFSTTMFNGATWVGTYDDTNLADSTNWRDYTWTPLKGDTGPQGPSGQTIWDVMAYKFAQVAGAKPSVTSNITTSTVDFGNGWKSTPQAPSYTGERISSTTVDNTGLNSSSTAGAMTVWAALDSSDACYTGLTTNFGEGWKVAKGNDAHSKYVVDRLYFTPKTNSARITFQIGASSESNYDGVLIGNVGAAATTSTNWSSGSGKCTYGKSIYTGTAFNANGVVTVDITVSNKAAQQTFIDVMYKKDSSGSRDLDCGYYRIVRSEGVNWVSTATVTNGTVGTGGWSTPVKWQGQDGVDGANGANGAPADYYELEPIVEEAKVKVKNGSTEYPEGTLYVNVSYNIIHVVGDTRTTITPNKTSGYHVKISDSNSGPSAPYNFTISGNAISYTNVTYQQPYHTATSPIQWIKCEIVYGSNHAPVNSNIRYTNVTFEAGAVLSVTDSISATVQGQQSTINGLEQDVANVQITADNVQSTVTALRTGDTYNKWYPACYNSVMQSSDNAFIVTDILGTADNNPYYWICQNNNNYGVPINNSTTKIEWMSSSPSGQAIGNTGTVYLYSPYYKSSATELTYTITFDYNANNRFYIEVITYNGIAGARTAYKNIKSTSSSIKTVNSGSGSYDQWVQNFTVAANTYFRVRIRMNPTGTGATPTYTFGKFSMYVGSKAVGDFEDWNEAMSLSTSVISQTADSIKLGVEKAGLNISTGKITSIANKFEWQNSNGDKILYMDSKGNANFAGTIRAKNFFKTLAVTSTVGHSIIFDPNGVGTSIAYIKKTFRCDENEQTYIAGYYYEVPTNAWWDIFYYDQDKINLCTGSADEVVVIPDGYTSGGTYVVYVPRARDYTGKQITIRHTIVTGNVYIRQCDYTDNLSAPWPFSSDGIHFSSGTDNVTIEPGNHMVNQITANKGSNDNGEIITLYAIGSGNDAYWVVWRQSL